MADDRCVHLRRNLREAEQSLCKLQVYLMENCHDVPRGGGIVEWAINALEGYRYRELEHQHLGCPVEKTGIYAEEASEACATCGRPTR